MSVFSARIKSQPEPAGLVDLPGLIFVAWVWAAAVLIPMLRNVRFMGFLAIVSMATLASEFLPDRFGLLVRLGIAVLVVIVAGLADRIGLGSMTRTELNTDHLLDRADALASSGSAEDVQRAISLLDSVIAGGEPLDGRWRAEVRMRRRVLLARLGISPLPPGRATREQSLRLAAYRWLTDLRYRRTIRFRPSSGARDESIALRAYLEDIRSILPQEPMGPEQRERGPWVTEARHTIAELDAVELHDPGTDGVRRLLAQLVELELEMHLTAPTYDDAARYDRLSAELQAAWDQVDAEQLPARG